MTKETREARRAIARMEASDNCWDVLQEFKDAIEKFIDEKCLLEVVDAIQSAGEKMMSLKGSDDYRESMEDLLYNIETAMNYIIDVVEEMEEDGDEYKYLDKLHGKLLTLLQIIIDDDDRKELKLRLANIAP